MPASPEKLFFENPLLYKAKCFVIETVIWKWILSGMLRLEPNPLPDVTRLFDGKKVLLAACGPGDVSTGPSPDAAKEVVAFDISQEFVDACKKNHPNWAVFQGDITRIPYGDGEFDLAVIYSSLHHIPISAEVVLAELARVTRGRILILEGVVPDRGLLRRALLTWYAIVDGGVHYYTRDELVGVFAKLGLEVEELSQHGPIRHMMLTVLRTPHAVRATREPVDEVRDPGRGSSRQG
jgi:ubiquinone/menaquinone biosynthesis C-methylase UbiE